MPKKQAPSTEWGASEPGSKSRIRTAAVVAAVLIMLASVFIAHLLVDEETADVLVAQKFMAGSAADTLASSLQASLDELVADLEALGRLYDSACHRLPGERDPYFRVRPAEFQAYAAAAQAASSNVDEFAFAAVTHDNEGRRYVEQTAAAAMYGGTPLPAWTLKRPEDSLEELPYANQTAIIISLIEPKRPAAMIAYMLELLSTADTLEVDGVFRSEVDVLVRSAQSGEPYSSTVFEVLAQMLVVLPVYKCGFDATAAALFDPPHTSPIIAGYLAATYDTQTFMATKFAPFTTLLEGFRVEVLEHDEDTGRHTLIYAVGPELQDDHRLSERQLVAANRQWSVQLYEPTTTVLVLENRLLTMMAVMPVALGAVAAIAIVAAAFVQHRQNQRSTKITLEAMDATHQYVVAYVCHEMRNPLHACLAYVELAMSAADGGGGESKQQAALAGEEVAALLQDLQSAKAAADQMAQVLDDVMDIRRLNQGQLTVTAAVMNNVSDVMRDLSNQYRYLLDPSVRLVTDLTACPGHLDRSRLRQVMGNGLHNAAKGTGQGFIALVTTRFTLPHGTKPSEGEGPAAAPLRNMNDVELGEGDRQQQSTGGVASFGSAWGFNSMGTRVDSVEEGGNWLLCEIISTPSSSLPAAVVKWNRELQERTQPPPRLVSLASRHYAAPQPLTPSHRAGARGQGLIMLKQGVAGGSSSGGVTPSAVENLRSSLQLSKGDSGQHSGAELLPGPSRMPLHSGSGVLRAESDTTRRAKSKGKGKGGEVVRHLRNKAGTGLGLALCARVVSAMGGYMGIHVDSRGQVRFWVAVPLGNTRMPSEGSSVVATDPPSPAAAAGSSGSGLTVNTLPHATSSSMGIAMPASAREMQLEPVVAVTPSTDKPPLPPKAGSAKDVRTAKVAVVDDEPVMRRTASRFLKKMGHVPVAFDDGLPLLNALVHDGNPEGIDMVLLDIVMHNSNGIEVCQALRASGVTIPIIAMTGNVDPASLEVYHGAGFNGALGKPFSRKKLLETVQSCL